MKSELVRKIDRYTLKEDFRGCFEGLIRGSDWREINFLVSHANVTRGGHYHKCADELFFIIEGEIMVKAQKVVDGKPAGLKENFHFVEGDVFVIYKMTDHVFRVLSESRWINALSEAFNEDHPDIFTLA